MQKKTSLRPAAASLILTAALLSVSACGGGSAGKGGAPAASSALTGPAETVELYRNYCITCHGSDLEGKMGDASDLRTVGARLTKEQLVRQIEDGGDLMPPQKTRLTAEQIDALAEWLSSKR